MESELFGIYAPEVPGNSETNFDRRGQLFSTRKEAEDHPDAKKPGAVVLGGQSSSLECTLPKPAVNELAGRDVPVPFSCGCLELSRCQHRGEDGGFGLVPARKRGCAE